ncbi:MULTISPECIES: aldo/keto reductase [Elizabethkingia]|uniref:aldo/keto reductase n=1 Tax=Elizabethkingia TaxID=308865 RepID=UPI001907FE2A|nr:MULTISPECIES: aldo/keto reductase [Elizabethkingia]QQM28201.1 aldo/keto reductase [Elizabethkingia sp. M8]CAH1145327.1 hypothetical protein EAVVTKC53_01928 [Elizabethkingia anophelis]CAI9679618.1 hypothetical protein EAVVTKC53_01059 [Elizabethkingia anophelis]
MLNINEISKIGIGTYRMNIDNSQNYEAINYAIESGINIIDTASNYCLGKSELLIGYSISKQIRNSVFIISKAGYIQGDDINKIKNSHIPFIKLSEESLYSIEPDFISLQLENSLKRMKLDYIDCYLIHNPEYYYKNKISKEDVKKTIFDSFSLLEEKVKEGKIRYYGISSNTLSSLPLKNILESLDQYPNFKFLQFPYNILERNSNFQLDNFNNISISELKNKGLIILSNRPLNTIYEDKVLRLVDYHVENIHSIEKQEQTIFNSFKSTIKERLIEIGEDSSLENYYPINFFIENRKNIANQAAISESIDSYLYPFLQALQIENNDIFENLNKLKNFWLIFSQYNNQIRLNTLKDKLYDEGILTNDQRELSLVLAENYLNAGIDSVLMGLRKKKYIDKIKPILI